MYVIERNNMIRFPVIYKRAKSGAIQQWQVIADSNTFFTIEGLTGGVLTTSKPTVCKGKNIGKTNETSPNYQAECEAKAKMDKKLSSGYTEDISKIDTAISYFDPMLAQPYDKRLGKWDISKGVYIQPKLDGMRCITQNSGMSSRNGKPIISSPHIHRAFNKIFKKNPLEMFDGELYTNKFKKDFNKIISLVKQTQPDEDDIIDAEEYIEYWVYDYPSCDETFSVRTRKLRELITPELEELGIVYVETHFVTTMKELNYYYDKWREEGLEGQIIRLDAMYENKRSNSLIKRKEFITEEYLILDVVAGEGNKTGMAGAITCQLKKGVTFNANIKGGWKKLREIWVNRENYIGKMATIRFPNFTPDGVPRFPYFIITRDYE